MAILNGGPPSISIIIPCLGHARELELCLQALDLQEGGHAIEVIVVDSAFDAQVQAVAGRFPSVQLIRSKDKLSAGAARNLGAKHSVASTLGFIDADCVPQPGWVEAALKSMQEGAVLVGGPVLDLLPWNLIASSDNRLQFVDFPAQRPAGTHPYFPSAHVAVVRTAFEAVGRFDEKALVAQDVMFATRVFQLWPKQARYCPQMIVRHPGRERWADFLEHQRSFGFGRAEFNVRMDRSLTWLGEHRGLAWVVILRRLVYISARVIQWNMLDLPRFLLQLPILLVGLVAWTDGFYAGMRVRSAGGSK